MATEVSSAGRALRAPRAAAIAGIVFSLLDGASLVLLRLAVPRSLRQAAAWDGDPARQSLIVTALALVPFAGIAFLWFIGVVRTRIGDREDRFFATVFLGSGLLYVAMSFVSACFAGGLVAIVSGRAVTNAAQESDLWQFGSQVTYALAIIYAMRMAAVFMISTATIALQIGIMPRWLVLLGYVCAVVLLVSVGYVVGVELVFPGWVLLVSAQILRSTLRSADRSKA
jgi:hypothetical protein